MEHFDQFGRVFRSRAASGYRGLPGRVRTVFAHALGVAACAVVAGCADPSPTTQSGQLAVAATTTMVADLVREVGGERVEVSSLMGAGVDPHLYKATPSDLTKLQSADAIFYSGLHLEGRMTGVLEKIARQGRDVYAVTDSIPKERLLRATVGAQIEDPHVWFDPELWALAVETVVKGLSETDPEGADMYRERGNATRDRILETRAWAEKRLKTVPPDRRVLVTSHDAFAYFGRAYDFRVVAIQGISTATEAGLGDIVAMIDFIKSEGVPSIFVESSVPHATIERVSRDAGVRVAGELFSDALGAKGDIRTGSDGESYDVGSWHGTFKHNVDTIVEGLATP